MSFFYFVLGVLGVLLVLFVVLVCVTGWMATREEQRNKLF